MFRKIDRYRLKVEFFNKIGGFRTFAAVPID